MKHSEEQLDQQLQQWYQQSRQQQGMPEALKKQLVQTIATQPTPRSWFERIRQMKWQLWHWRRLQALTAVLALGVGWQLWQQEQLYYQISQSNDVYPVQVHQIAPQQQLADNRPQRPDGAGQRRALYAQRYQDYLNAREHSAVQRQTIVSRQVSADGWHLDLCQQLQLQLTREWLAQFKQQQHLTEAQWQQLQKSEWLQITTGGQGQILTLQQSSQPPACAP